MVNIDTNAFGFSLSRFYWRLHGDGTLEHLPISKGTIIVVPNFSSLKQIGNYLQIKSLRLDTIHLPSLVNVGNYITIEHARAHAHVLENVSSAFEVSMPRLEEVAGSSGERSIYVYDVDAVLVDFGGLKRTKRGGITVSTNDYLYELRLQSLLDVAGSLVVDSNVAMKGLSVPSPGTTVSGDVKIMANLQLFCFSMNQAVRTLCW